MVSSLLKYAFDNGFIRKNVLKTIPKKFTEARDYLSSWEEMWILFMSPFLRAQSLVEERGQDYLASHDSCGLPVPNYGLTIRDLRLVRKQVDPILSIDEMAELRLLARGSLALYSRSEFESRSVTGTRIGLHRVRLKYESRLLVKALRRINRNWNTK